jgi:hypothetical protein
VQRAGSRTRNTTMCHNKTVTGERGGYVGQYGYSSSCLCVLLRVSVGVGVSLMGRESALFFFLPSFFLSLTCVGSHRLSVIQVPEGVKLGVGDPLHQRLETLGFDVARGEWVGR